MPNSGKPKKPTARHPNNNQYDEKEEPDIWTQRLEILKRHQLASLVGSILFNFLGFALMIIAVVTENWVVMEYQTQHSNSTRAKVYTGIWRKCTSDPASKTPKVQHCALTEVFKGEDHVKHSLDIDATLLNYSRSEVAFAIISLLLMALGAIFSCYTIRHPQAHMKKLSGLLHISASVSGIILTQVFQNGVAFEKSHVPTQHPEHSRWSFGYSYILVWVVIVIYFCTSIVFFVFSKVRTKSRESKSGSCSDEAEIDLYQMT